MPAKDAFHETVINALRKDGWHIRADPMHLKWGKRDFFVDLATEKFFFANKGERHIAVGVKSIRADSAMADLEHTLGQFLIYRSILKRREPQRKLYLAVDLNTFRNIFEDDIGLLIIEDYVIPLIVFNPQTEEVIEWTL
jgi:hypothetical protein